MTRPDLTATAAQAVRLLDDGPLRYLPWPLREARRAWLAILTGFGMSIVGSLILAAASHVVAPDIAAPEFPLKGPIAFFMLVGFAPLVETLIMAVFLTLFLRFMRPAYAIVLSSLGWGIAHSLEALGWGLVIWWPFLIFSTLFVVWRQKGFWAGVAVAATTHALQNTVPAWLVAFG